MAWIIIAATLAVAWATVGLFVIALVAGGAKNERLEREARAQQIITSKEQK